jgi:ribonuclease HI
MSLKLFFDGACEPVNPGGVGAYGFAVYEDDREVHGEGGVVCVGGWQCTNNVAERNARADYYSKKAYCDFLKTHPEVRRLYAGRLATERQVALLKRLGVEDAECLPRREASRLIERLLSRRGT